MTAHCFRSLSGFESGWGPVRKSNDLGLGVGFPAVRQFPSPLTTGLLLPSLNLAEKVRII